MKRALLLIFAALATVAAALLLWQMQSVLVLLVAAIALGAAIRPAAEKLHAVGAPRSLSTLLMVLLILVLVFGLIAILGFTLGEELPLLIRDVQGQMLVIRAEWQDGAQWQQTIASYIPSPVGLDEMVASMDAILSPPADGAVTTPPVQEGSVPATPSTNGADTQADAVSERDESASAMLRLMVGAAGGVAGFLGQFIILIFLSLYWSLEHEWFERMWISLLPAQQRGQARNTWRTMEANVGAHIRSEVLQSIIAGALIYIGLRLLGVEQSLLLATLAALAWLIPLVGGIVALAILIPIAIVSPLWVTIASAALIVAVLVLMEFVVEPRLDRGRERMEIFGLIMAMIMLQLFGIFGLLLASPLAVAIASVAANWDSDVEYPERDNRATLESTLRTRMATLRQLVAAKGDELPQRTRSLYQRLEEVLDAAEADSGLRIEKIGPLPAPAGVAQGDGVQAD